MISYKHLGRVRSGNTFGFAKSRSLLTNGRQSGDSRLTRFQQTGGEMAKLVLMKRVSGICLLDTLGRSH
jgi:hypothetical protein